MPVCSYYGQLNCSGPVFGGNPASLPATAPPPAAPTSSLLSHLFGTNHFSQVLSVILYYLIIRYILWPLIVSPLLQIIGYRRLREVKLYTLEVTPHLDATANNKTDSYAFANALHEIGSLANGTKLLKRRPVISLEISSVRGSGIRYFIHLPREALVAVEQALTADMPGVKIKRLQQSNLSESKGLYQQVIELRQAAPYAYPLKDFKTDTEPGDPLRYLCAAMSNLEQNELVIYQVVLSPAPASSFKRARRSAEKGRLSSPFSFNWRFPYEVLSKLSGWILLSGAGLADKVLGSSGETADQHALKPHLGQTIAVDQARERLITKLNQPLFYANIRLLIESSEQQRLSEKQMSLLSALAAYNEPSYQKLAPSALTLARLPRNLKARHQSLGLSKVLSHLPSILSKNSCVLSADEVGGLFHLPRSESSSIDNLKVSASRTLPLAPALKDVADSGQSEIEIGQNSYQGEINPIGLTADERARHVYIVGGTGTGKTTMIEHMAIQDMAAGRGLAVIDPHGDLAKSLLNHVPQNRINDVIYFNPEDLLHPVGLNLLEIPAAAALSEEALEHEKELITEAVVSIFRKIFSRDDSGGHRVEYILRSAIQTALSIEGATLFTALKLIQDPYYRSHYVEILEDEGLKDFWKNEFGPAGGMQRVKMSAGVTAKLGRFWHSAAARRIFSQVNSTIDFADIMDTGKILICNFSKGALGEDVSELLGTAVLAKLQLAALRRSQLPQKKRHPFYLYIDEFQNFATDSFSQMLSESRKYNLRLTLAEQSTAQQKDQLMVEVILANVPNVICFRSASPKDEDRFLPMFAPYLERGEIANLPIYNFYAKLSGTCEVHPPTSGQTVISPNPKDVRTAAMVIRRSRRLYSGRYIKPVFNTVHLRPGDIPVKLNIRAAKI